MLGVMQPYFFPYLGHYQLILATQRWIVFDIVKYNRRSWMNRNRILHPQQGWQYVTTPVHVPEHGMIHGVTLVDPDASCRRILAQLAHYRRRAPHFDAVNGLVERAYRERKSDKLRDLNISSLAVVCDYLDIPFHYEICSEMPLDLPSTADPGQWALEISAAVRADTYLNPESGRELFVPADWQARGIELAFLRPGTMRYPTAHYGFEAHLSMLDVLMWNAPADIAGFMRTNLSITA